MAFVTCLLAMLFVTPVLGQGDMNRLSIAGTAIQEGDDGSRQAQFVVAVDRVPGNLDVIRVRYRTVEGTATDGQDFVGEERQLTIGVGQTSATVRIRVLGDTEDEPDETFSVELFAPEGAQIDPPGSAVATIEDDDDPAGLGSSLMVDAIGATTQEGNAGSTVVEFAIELSEPPTVPVQVSWRTEDGTATAADGDYIERSGPVGFGIGQTRRDVQIQVTGDTRVEDDEYFDVVLLSTSVGQLGQARARIEILDDDAETVLPGLRIFDASIKEDGGTVDVSVALSAAATGPVTMSYQTQDGTATAPADYLAKSGNLTLNAGQVSGTIQVEVRSDGEDEGDEVFRVTIDSVDGALLERSTAEVTIVDPSTDELVEVSLQGVSVSEGDGGTTPAFVTLERDGTTDQPVSVQWETVDGTATAADGDYRPESRTTTLGVGETSRQLQIGVLGDEVLEGNESFEVRIVSVDGGVIGEPSVATITILDDDDAPTLSVEPVSQAEGNDGQSSVTLQLRLSKAAAETITVGYRTEDGSAVSQPAEAADYVEAQGSIDIPAGATSAPLDLKVVGDLDSESDETFLVRLAIEAGTAVLTTPLAEVTILNDDVPPIEPEVVLTDLDVTETDAAFEAQLVVRLDEASDDTVTVDWTTEDGTAVAGSDYTAASGTLSFAPQTTQATLPLEILGDGLVEDDESFSVRFSNPVGALLPNVLAEVRIADDDTSDPPPTSPITVSIGNDRLREGNDGERSASLPVTLSRQASQEVRVDYATRDGSARAGEDYVDLSGTLIFPPGTTSATVAVAVLGDTVTEPDERFQVEIVSVSGGGGDAVIGTGIGRVTIVDDDGSSEEPPVEPGPERVETVEVTARVDSEIPLEIVATDASGAPVGGARILWSSPSLSLLDPATGTTAADGSGGQRVAAGPMPGVFEVEARVPTTNQRFVFEISVEGDTRSLFDEETNPNETSVAGALDRACTTASGDLARSCDYAYSLDEAGQRELVEDLVPDEVAAQASAALESLDVQRTNVRVRQTALRAGTARALGQLSMSVGRDSLSIGQLAKGLSATTSAVDLGEKVSLALAEMRGVAPTQQASSETVDSSVNPDRRLGLFVNGRITFGDRDRTALEQGYDFETRGLTLGGDYRVGARTWVGLAVGYLDGETDLDLGAGESSQDGYTITAYTTMQAQSFYLDASVSTGRLDYDFQRVIGLPAQFEGRDRLVATSSTDSDSLSGTLGLGYDFRVGKGTLTGLVRGSYSEVDIDGFQETGADGFNLAIDAQEVESLLIETGLDFAWPIGFSWGVMQPTFKVSHFHEAENDSRAIGGRFALDATGERFLILTENPDRDYFNVGAGLSFTLKRARSFYLLFDTDLERDDLDTSTVSFGFRQQF